MQELTEQWRPIKDFEGLYEISNFGRVKSLARKIKGIDKGCMSVDRLLKMQFTTTGYYFVGFSKNGIMSRRKTHLLVWEAFGDRERNGHILQIDHIDNNKLNNRVDNLRLISQRENTTKYHLTKEKSSRFTGAVWHKLHEKWISHIRIDGIVKHLGYFNCETAAAIAYQKAKIVYGVF